jgi:hypothetical protein
MKGIMMSSQNNYRRLSRSEREALENRGCDAQNWDEIHVSEGFSPNSVRNVHFHGKVEIGNLNDKIKTIRGIEMPCGIYNATIIDCTIGDQVRIANIGVHISNYDIADNVCIENVATMQTNPGATFGNGVEVDVLNESGGREVVLFDGLSAQFAYIVCMHRYRPEVVTKLQAMAKEYAQSVRSDRGKAGCGVRICSTTEIIDVNVGSYATINGAASLVNGTILSTREATTTIGAKVVAEDFIIAESSSVTGGAVLGKVFVGQGCQVGKQYSAENSLFFANSEVFHGEACSVFAGPYTVTHHKSTLLIAGLFSFYNAGSGTNQSNHMYKLGPVHEGKLLRGVKTGSFSYMMWPCRVGPFSVVLGKHSGTFDTADFPFSHIEARPDGKAYMVPGLHMMTVGTVRDGAKWPSRDRRKSCPVKRDVISFDVFSPYTVGKMLIANSKLKNLYESTEKSVEEVSVGGAIVKRPILRTGQKYYRTGIEMYLLEKVVRRVEENIGSGMLRIRDAFAVQADVVYSDQWVDIGGQLMPKQRLVDLEEAIENGTINTVEAFAAQTDKIHRAYSDDEWIWVKNTYQQVFGLDLDGASKDDIINCAQAYLKVKSKFLNLVIADSEKEFDQLSHCGFGQDGSDGDIEEDFRQVRGSYEDNKFVKEMKDSVKELQQRIELLEQRLSSL